MEDIDEEEYEDEVMKMIMRGRKEKKMKEKMTNVTLMNANLPFFNFLQSQGASCSLFFPSPLVLSFPL